MASVRFSMTRSGWVEGVLLVQDADVLGGPAATVGAQDVHVHPLVSHSHRKALPLVGVMMPLIILERVVLPPPQTPTRPKISPSLTIKADIVHGFDHAPVDADVSLGKVVDLDYRLAYLYIFPLAKLTGHRQELGGHILGISNRLDLALVQEHSPCRSGRPSRPPSGW